MKRIILDLKLAKTREEFYLYINKIFGIDCEKYRVDNLDALWDRLTEERKLDIVVYNAELIIENLGNYGNDILELFTDLAKDGYKVEIHKYFY